MPLAVVYAVAAVLFLLLLISLGFKPKFIARINGIVLTFVGLAGLFFYGYGFYALFGGTLRTMVRTLFAVFCMFLGRNEIGTISSVPLLATDGMQILIYFTHLLALYCTASAVVSGIGKNFIRTLNLLLINRGDLNLIFGVSADSVSFAEQLPKKQATVMIAAGGEDTFSARVMRMGGLLLTDDAAQTPSPALLKKLGIRPGTRRYAFYCLEADPVKNLRFASDLRDALYARGIAPAQTTLTILTDDASVGEKLQTVPGQAAGFGSVLSVNRSELIARMLVNTYPPCQTMTFRPDGTAAEDFSAVIVGFGSTGQAVLRSLLMNGQFAGSTFHAEVLSLDHAQLAGSFFFRYPGIRENYDIHFLDTDARSAEAYQYLAKNAHTLNYVAVCTGNELENAEILRDLTGFLADLGRRVPVVSCSEQGICRLEEETGLPKHARLLSPAVLDLSRMDARAMLLNHRYNLSAGRSVEEDWAVCDYFSRCSCRASADFLEAFLAATGCTVEQAAQGNWQPAPEVLENLGRMEHLRWCAFHYCMGYTAMPDQVFDARAAQYQAQKAAGTPTLRITKDPVNRQHACLVDWEKLDALAAREAAATGVLKDYKAMDVDNVMLIPAMLKEASHD